MMRMQIHVRDDLVEILSDLAWRENRHPKQQAEWLLQQALQPAPRRSTEARPLPYKISTLIADLQALMERDGDIPVYRLSEEGRIPVEQVGTYEEDGEKRVEID